MEERLTWDQPQTSKQAAQYHLTSGFIAEELYRSVCLKNKALESRIAELEQRNRKLVEKLEAIRKYINEITWAYENSPIDFKQVLKEAEGR